MCSFFDEGLDDGGERMGSLLRASFDVGKDGSGEFVDAGGDVFADVFFWFFDDAADVAVFDDDDPVFGGMGVFFDEQCMVCGVFDEFGDACGIDDVVPGKHDEGVFDVFFCLEEGMGGAELSVLGDVGDFDVFVVFEVFHDDFFFVADDDDDFVDAAFFGCVKDVFEEGFIGDREHDLRHGFGEWSESFSFTGR